MTVEVIAQRGWKIHWGGINRLGGVEGRVTKCRLGGATFYVRENLAGKGELTVSSGVRQAMKRGAASGLPQVLDLLAPAERWDEIALAVRALDSLNRPVRRHRQFTWAWAEDLFGTKP